MSLLNALQQLNPNGFNEMQQDAIDLISIYNPSAEAQILSEIKPYYNVNSTSTLEEFAAHWIMETDGLETGRFASTAVEIFQDRDIKTIVFNK